MAQKGFLLIKVLKTINLYLWAETREELEGYMTELKCSPKDGFRIVPCYKDGNATVINVDGKMLRLD